MLAYNSADRVQNKSYLNMEEHKRKSQRKFDHQQTCNTRNVKGCPSGRRQSDGNQDPYKGIMSTRIGNYMGKHKDFFFSCYLNIFKRQHKQERERMKVREKERRRTTYCEVSNTCRNKMYGQQYHRSSKGRNGNTLLEVFYTIHNTGCIFH